MLEALQEGSHLQGVSMFDPAVSLLAPVLRMAAEVDPVQMWS